MRAKAMSYWFTGYKRADIFKEFARDEQIQPDSSKPTLFIALYCDLVWGEYSGNEILDLRQLRDVVQQSFQSAYSPLENDNVWERKFKRWWKQFRSSTPQLKLETTYEPTIEGAKVRGYAFSGYQLTIPWTGPPTKGAPRVFQWALLVKPDGTVEQLPSKIIYSAR